MPKSITHQNNKTMETKVQVEMTAEQAEAFKQFQEKQAKEEAARIIERANKEAELEKQKAADDVKQQIVAVSAMIASKLIAKSIDESESNAIIEQTLNEMGENTWRN